jgi:hypothetical protein
MLKEYVLENEELAVDAEARSLQPAIPGRHRQPLIATV